MVSKNTKYLRIAVFCPIRKSFDYLPYNNQALPAPGVRVRASFGRRKVIGVVLAHPATTDCPADQLKTIDDVLDEQAILPKDLLRLLQWASDYYHHAIGDVVSTALPKKLREGFHASLIGEKLFQLTDAGRAVAPETLNRSPKQAIALRLLHAAPQTQGDLQQHAISLACLKTLEKKGWLGVSQKEILPSIPTDIETPLTLNAEQQQVVETIGKQLDQHQVHLLHGITGSGKTEVYFHIIQKVLDHNQQVLVLIPEISLTPQTLTRFKKRFAARIAHFHSGLNDTERMQAWLLAKLAKADIIIGTRSAVFTPLPKLGLIIVDEEHDSSFKQQEGFRYHARDLAVFRAHQHNRPIILGSATPSLESFKHALNEKYYLHTLSQRAANAKPPRFTLVDLRNKNNAQGLSQPVIQAMNHHLNQNRQVLIFINRRGYAPVLFCTECQWRSECHRCDAKLVVHRKHNKLICHHCGYQQAPPSTCPECHKNSLIPLGQGTERLEEMLTHTFPQTPITRVDRDTTRSKSQLEALYQTIHDADAHILIGTQMLAKGHHFPKVTLVVILDIDSGFISADFRSEERTGQLLLQVAGRAGRAKHPGEVMIQTYQPDLPVLHQLIDQGYGEFVKTLLTHRQQFCLPPYVHWAVFRAESKEQDKAMSFLETVRQQLLAFNHMTVFGPMPTTLQRKAGFFRAELILQTSQRQIMTKTLHHLLQAPFFGKSHHPVKWMIDVDPV